MIILYTKFQRILRVQGKYGDKVSRCNSVKVSTGSLLWKIEPVVINTVWLKMKKRRMF